MDDYPRLDFIYWLVTDGQTDRRTDGLTLVLVKSLSRLKSGDHAHARSLRPEV